MPDNIAISVENVSKTFKLPHERINSIKGALINIARRKKGYEIQQVLNGVSLQVRKGEFFGIVGRNGSGKSTLLKMLAGIYTPTAGEIHINGKLTPFIELGVGFNPELTGRENVFLNGALLGFTRQEVQGMYKDIVEFAELSNFMDQKLKNYSSGMQVRLAFSIAIRAQSDILVLDEVLAVGDMAFQRKCFEYFMHLKASKQTVVLVTHDMAAVRQYCDKAIMIEEGKIIAKGSAEDVAQAYQKLFNQEIEKEETKEEAENTASNDSDETHRWGTGKIITERVTYKLLHDRLEITTLYRAKQQVSAPIFGFSIFGPTGDNIIEGNTQRAKLKTKNMNVNDAIYITWSIPNIFGDGVYKISAAVCNASTTEFYDWLNDAASFTIHTDDKTGGIVNPPVVITKYEVKQ